MPIWNPKYETLQRPEIEQIQLEGLQATVNRAYRNVPFYHRQFESMDIEPEAVRSLADAVMLPFTTRDDLRAGYPYALFAVPLREIVRIHAASGAAFRPMVAGYTRNDLKHWAELTARVLSAAGITKDDVVQIAFDEGLLTGAFGMQSGAEQVGASVIPVASGDARPQIRIMQDFKSTALACRASYALSLTAAMEEMGIEPSALKLRRGLFTGEPMSEAARERIRIRWGIRVTGNYSVSAVMGPGIAGECERQNGMHLNEDHFLAEIIDPDTLKPVVEGAEGELVLTTLTKEGLPLIRYRTRDVTRLLREPCPCGRTTARIAPIRRRTDDRITVRGIHIYPSDVEALLYDIEHVEPHFQIVLERPNGLDEMTLRVEMSSQIVSDQVHKLMALEETITRRVQSTLGITPRVRLVEPKSLKNTTAAGRVADQRE